MKSSTWVTIALLAAPQPAAAQRAAPAPDASRLTLGVDSLAVFLIQGRDTVRTGIIVDELAVDSTAGTPRLVRVYWSQDRVLGQRVDTIVDAFTTLQPIAYRSRASTGFQFLDFTPGHVTGWLSLSNGDSVGIDHSLPRPVYNSASFDLVLRASALRDSVAFTVPGFLATTRSVTPFSARVVGRGTIAGRECWVVRAEFAGMPVTFWIDVETRHLRQQVMQVRQDTRILFTTLRSARTGRRATERPERSRSYSFEGQAVRLRSLRYLDCLAGFRTRPFRDDVPRPDLGARCHHSDCCGLAGDHVWLAPASGAAKAVGEVSHTGLVAPKSRAHLLVEGI